MKMVVTKPMCFRLCSLSWDFIWIWFIFSITLYKEISAKKSDSLGVYYSADRLVRLIDGTRYASGRAEVYVSGRWGTICDNSWDEKDTMVLCKQLGFRGGYKVETHKRWYGPIWFHNVRCLGNESSIFDCGYDRSSYCQRYSSVSVQCNFMDDIEFCQFVSNDCGFAINSSSTYKWRYSNEYIPMTFNIVGQDNTNLMFIESTKGNPGDETQLSNKTGIDIDKGSIIFKYYLRGDQILNVFIGAGGKGHLVWSGSDNGENSWRFTTLTINKPIKDLVITFVAVRGSSPTSAMAIAEIRITTKIIESENVSCAFNGSQCGYEIIKSEYTSFEWFFSRPYNFGPSADHTTNSTDGGFMAIFNNFLEGKRTTLRSPAMHTNQSDKVEFYYYMSGLNPGELQVAFVNADPQMSDLKKPILWQEYGDHGIGWNYACVNLPPNQKGKINFTVVSGPAKNLSIAIDDILVSQGQCKALIFTETAIKTCTFSISRSCDYAISCGGKREYTWKRHRGTTPTHGTGPDSDFSRTKNGFYLYTESSFGDPGDSTTVTFPVVKVKAVKYLRFWYHMYGKGIGSLHLRYHSLHSKKEIWTVAGNQGNKWRGFCMEITSGTDAFSLFAVRGSSHLGDIAIDDIRIDQEICAHPLDCDFINGICNYEFMTNGFDYHWISKPYSTMQIRTKSSHQEEATSSLISPEINTKNSNGSLIFMYQMYGADVNKLTIFSQDLKNNETVTLWSTNDNRITEWTEECVDLPSLEKMKIIFMSTNGFGKDGITKLDYFFYRHQKCPTKQTCNFDYHKDCGYKIKCYSSSYKWIRSRTSPTSDTGPDTDHTGSLGKGYFMYAESSQGHPGDRTDLQFPAFISPPDHYFLFHYNMNGQDIGQLQVYVDTGSERTLRWFDAGDLKDFWVKGCIKLSAGENTTVIFTATRGDGPLGDIAIDDVSVVPGRCPDRSIACQFNDDFLCGYKNVSIDPGWTRIYKDSGFHMKTNYSNRYSLMRSPIMNISNSCIRIHYLIESEYSSLYVYSNLEEKLLLFGNVSMFGQFYIEKAQMFLQFDAKRIYSGEILLSEVEIISGKCPSLDCPDGMVACKDQRYCIMEKWMCDKEQHCLDGSDEDGCPTSIACDFSTGFSCGYEYFDWYWIESDSGSLYLSHADYNTSLTSPMELVDDVCVRFSYRAINQFSLYVLVHYKNPDGSSSHTRWQLQFKNHELSWRTGQFYINAGNASLEFKASVSDNALLQIDNVMIIKDYCSPLNCSSDTFLCGSGEKCINKNDKCNRYHECEDKSDEQNCPSSLECDFEDRYACGYEFTTNWTLTTGRHNMVPRIDHSKKRSHGHYMATTFIQKGYVHLVTPEKKITRKKCLTFFYSLQGNSQFHIYDNNFLKLIIRPFNIATWQKSQLQLDEGVHKVRFSVFLNSTDDKLALDSISTSNGTCPELVCEEKWKRCQPDNICIPHFKFCDHEDDCPNGYDERNCHTFTSVRLVAGENIHQGFPQYYHNGKWNTVCSRYGWLKKESSVVCRELKYNSTMGWNSLKAKETYLFTDIQYVRCSGHETSLSQCKMNFCENCVCRHDTFVDCSNSNCSSSQSPCPAKKTENGTLQGHETDICISKELFCDGEQDCLGGTDENNCHKCKADEFQCLNKKCISMNQRCDLIDNCEDSTDEHHCFKHNGTAFFFLQDEKYQAVCEDNLNNQEIANKLCNAVGKSNAIIRQSVSSGKGVVFTRNQSIKNRFLPGLSPNAVQSCNFLNVLCNSEECGTRGRILNEQPLQNGISSFLGQWPWQAVLKTDDEMTCGGILIHPKYVLTNAYCLADKEIWSVSFGTINKTSGGVKYQSKHKIVQSELDPYSVDQIALMELTESVRTTDFIRPVCLPSKPHVSDRECFSTGWGEGGSYNYPHSLKEVKVYLLSRDECISYFRDASNVTQCATSDNNKRLGCLVDTGGPLVCRNQHGIWEVVGIVKQHEIYCGGDNYYPITYLDIYSSLNWILQHLT